MSITEEEKIRRRKSFETNDNIIGAGFGEEIDPRIKNIPEAEKYINGEIEFEEYQEAIMEFIKNL
jgi:hypothetical protein